MHVGMDEEGNWTSGYLRSEAGKSVVGGGGGGEGAGAGSWDGEGMQASSW